MTSDSTAERMARLEEALLRVIAAGATGNSMEQSAIAVRALGLSLPEIRIRLHGMGVDVPDR